VSKSGSHRQKQRCELERQQAAEDAAMIAEDSERALASHREQVRQAERSRSYGMSR